MQRISELTIVIPLFNKARTIGRCLESIQSQSVWPSAVLLVDDGSQDGGASVAENFPDLPLRVIRQPNQGVSAARNRGIIESETEWIALLDADDEFCKGALDAFKRAVEVAPNANAVCWDYHIARDFGLGLQQGSRSSSETQSNIRLIDNYFEYLLQPNSKEIHSSSVVIRKEVLIRCGLFPAGVAIGEDSDMWFRVGCTGPLARISETLSIYHISSGDSQWEDHLREIPFWYGTYREWLSKSRIPANIAPSARRWIGCDFARRLIFLAKSGLAGEARRLAFGNLDILRRASARLQVRLLMCMCNPSNRIADLDHE